MTRRALLALYVCAAFVGPTASVEPSHWEPSSEDQRIEVLRIPKTGSSALGSLLMKRPECKERVRFHPNHPKSMERAYLQHHNQTESSGVGSAELAKNANRPSRVPGSWNKGLSDTVHQTVTVVRQPCERFGSIFSALKGLNVSLVRRMDHPDQLVKWLSKHYGHMSLDPWGMAKQLERDEKAMLQNRSYDSLEDGRRRLSTADAVGNGANSWDRNTLDSSHGQVDGLNRWEMSESMLREVFALGCDFKSGCLRWADSDGSETSRSGSETPRNLRSYGDGGGGLPTTPTAPFMPTGRSADGLGSLGAARRPRGSGAMRGDPRRLAMVVWPFLAPAAAYVSDKTNVVCYGKDITERFVAKYCKIQLSKRDASKRVGGRRSDWTKAELSPASCLKLKEVYPLDFRIHEGCGRLRA